MSALIGRIPSYYYPTKPGRKCRVPKFLRDSQTAALKPHSGLARGEHARRAFCGDGGDSPGYRDPTPREIWERRIEVHELRGEDAIADELRRRGPPADIRQAPLDADEADCPGLTPITYLGLHFRTVEILDQCGVLYAGELCGFTEKRLLRIPCIGALTVAAIRAALAPLGLRLRDDPLPRRGSAEPKPGTVPPRAGVDDGFTRRLSDAAGLAVGA